MEYRLDELFDLQMGKTPSRNNPVYWNSKDHKWISIGDLSKCGKYIYETKEYLSDAAVQESGISIIPANTVIMSFKLSIGKTAITTEPMYSNEAIMSFRDLHTEDLLPDYVYYLLSSKDWDVGTNKAVMGKTLNKATLSQVRISVHPIFEQTKIVQILDGVRTIIEARKRELQALDNLIKARFVELFGQDGFDYVRVGDVIIQQTVVERITHPEQEKYVTVGIRGTGARQRVIKDGKTPVPFSGYRVKAGEFIYSRIDARNGAFAVLSDQLDGAVVSKDFPVFTINKERIYPEFLLQSVLQEDFISQIRQSSFGATNRQRIKEDVFAEYKIKLPSLHHQSQFATLVAQVDKSKAAVQKALDEAQLLFDSLMQQYFG